jgi:DNA-binding HxlR family transcriptional regulator
MSGPPGCCPQQEAAIDLLAKRHTLHIVWLLQREAPRRFNEIKRELGINPVSLTQRLSELESSGILVRETFREAPPRVEYRLTPMGQDLLPIIDALGSWARRHREFEEAAAKAASSSPTHI